MYKLSIKRLEGLEFYGCGPINALFLFLTDALA